MNLVQAMYECLSPSLIRSKINIMYCDAMKLTGSMIKGNELTTEVMKSAHAIKSENVCSIFRFSDHFRKRIEKYQANWLWNIIVQLSVH